MSEVPTGLVTLNNNVMAALDIETTGLVCGYHDIVQVAIVPLDQNLNPDDSKPPFYLNMKPLHPERAHPKAMEVNGLNLEDLAHAPEPWELADELDTWFERMNLPLGKRLIYLTQNAPFDIPFMKTWLGNEGFDKYFCRRGRDTMFLSQGINDSAAWKCKPIPFPEVGLKSLCNKLGIQFDNHHDALADCIATARVYRELLRFEL